MLCRIKSVPMEDGIKGKWNMHVWKPLTKKEDNFNRRNPQHKIEPYLAFYIDEDKYPEEAKLWLALGFEEIRQMYAEINKK